MGTDLKVVRRGGLRGLRRGGVEGERRGFKGVAMDVYLLSGEHDGD